MAQNSHSFTTYCTVIFKGNKVQVPARLRFDRLSAVNAPSSTLVSSLSVTSRLLRPVSWPSQEPDSTQQVIYQLEDFYQCPLLHGAQSENSSAKPAAPRFIKCRHYYFSFYVQQKNIHDLHAYNCLFRCAVPCSFHFEISLKHQCHTIFFTSVLLHESTVEPTLDS